jgi:hypothetical protein
MPERSRKLQQVNLTPLHHALRHRPTRNPLEGIVTRDLPPTSEPLRQNPNQVGSRQLAAEPQGDTKPGRRGVATGQHPVAVRVARDLIEQQRGWRGSVEVELTSGADLEVPVRTVDGLELAELVYLPEPGPKVA